MSAVLEKAIARLESLLAAKEEENDELMERVRYYEKSEEEEIWVWTKHVESKEIDGLPVPRLEMRWTVVSSDRYNWVATYSLVYRHLLGHFVSVPIGCTKVGGGNGRGHVFDGKVDLPFRDGAHIAHDAATLCLPAYAICEGTIMKIEPEERVHP